jgi:hypothetical protein
MKINIDLNLLKKYELTANQYVWLYCVAHKNDKSLYKISNSELISLEINGFIKIQGKSIFLRPLIKEIFNSKDVESWIQEFRDLFKNTRSSKSMGDKQVVLKKMKIFVENNPEYTKRDILNAAQRYINQCTNDGIFIRQADYFIYKQEMVDGKSVTKSDLLSTLEDIDSSVEVVSKIESLKSDIKW